MRARFVASLTGLLVLTACAQPTSATTSEVPVDPDAQVSVSVVQWRNNAETAQATVELTNTGSAYTEFIIDTAVTDATGEQILAYGPVIVDATPGAEGVTGEVTLTGPFPADARLGVANLWGRTAGDEQIHTIELTGEQGDQEAPATPQPNQTTTALPVNELVAAGQEFAARLGGVQQECRQDTNIDGLICLSRRNTVASLLPDDAQDRVRVVPYFAQRSFVDGPPRAFELVSGDGEVCVGQRIDKQTSAQVAIAGSCSQRGLFPGFGGVTGLVSAVSVVDETATARPSWTGSAAPAPTTDVGLTDIGRAFPVGQFDVTADGVRTELSAIDTPSGEIAPRDTFTEVTFTVTNPTSGALDTQTLRIVVFDGLQQPLLVDETAAAALGEPPAQVIPPGGSVQLRRVFDLPLGVTATSVVVSDTQTGASVTIGLIPPPS
jgi:hypothetical protein